MSDAEDVFDPDRDRKPLAAHEKSELARQLDDLRYENAVRTGRHIDVIAAEIRELVGRWTLFDLVEDAS